MSKTAEILLTNYFKLRRGALRAPVINLNYLPNKSKLEITDAHGASLRSLREHCALNWDLSVSLNFLFVLRARSFGRNAPSRMTSAD